MSENPGALTPKDPLAPPPFIEKVAKAYNLSADSAFLAYRSIKAAGVNMSADQFELYLFNCAARGLNPISGDVKPIIMGGRVTIHIGIEARRKIAARSGLHVGTQTKYVYNVNGTIVESPFKPSPDAVLIGAHVIVTKKLSKDSDMVGTFEGYADLNEYGGEGGKKGNYDRMPHVMCAKSAETIALRQAFPEEFSGTYDEVELTSVPNAKVVDTTFVE